MPQPISANGSGLNQNMMGHANQVHVSQLQSALEITAAVEAVTADISFSSAWIMDLLLYEDAT